MQSEQFGQQNKWRRVLLAMFSAVGFAILVPIAALAATRIFDVEETRLVVLAQSVMPLAFLPVYLVLLLALVAKQRVLIAASALLVACHVAFVFPEYRPATSLPEAAETAPKLTIFSQNVKYDGERTERVAQTIRDKDADVVFIQELTPRLERLLREQGVLQPYPYSTVEPARGATGLGIWSKHPLSQIELMEEDQMPAIRAVVDVSGRQIVLWNIHTQSPPVESGTSTRGWRNDLRATRDNLHRESGDVIAAGDFNAVYSHRPYREIIGNGYRDVHIDRGRGYARTWPVESGRFAQLGGVIRIDHMLTRGSIRAVSIEETAGLGSDHRGMFSEVALL